VLHFDESQKSAEEDREAERLLTAVGDELVDCPDPVKKMLQEAATAVETIVAELSSTNGHPAQKERKTHPAAGVGRRRGVKAAVAGSTR